MGHDSITGRAGWTTGLEVKAKWVGHCPSPLVGLASPKNRAEKEEAGLEPDGLQKESPEGTSHHLLSVFSQTANQESSLPP